MFVHTFFFLAAVLVVGGVLPFVGALSGYLAGTQLVACLLVRFGDRHVPRWVLVGLVGILVVTAVVVWGLVNALPPELLALSVAVIGLLLGVGWSSFASMLSAVAVALPVCGLIQVWSAMLGGGDPEPGMILVLWTMVLWPMVALMAKGRLWAVASTLGVAAVLSVVTVIMHQAEARSVPLGAIVVAGWRHGNPLLVLGQVGLVVVAVFPLLVQSGRLWRGITLLGVLGSIVPLLLAWLAGPWPDGSPAVVWVLALPALMAAAIGGVGLLCTVRQVDLMATTAVRALTLGVGAGAAFLLPVLLHPPPLDALLAAVGVAVSPMTTGVVLAAFIAIAAQVAVRRRAPEVDTDEILVRQRRALREMHDSMSSYVSGLFASITARDRSWWRPESVVPLVIVAAAYPSWWILDPWQWLVVAMLVPGALTRGLIAEHLFLWTALQTLLLLMAVLVLGASLPVAAALVACGLVSHWFFVRWSNINAAWAYPGGLLIVVALWLVSAQHGIESILVATGLLLLVANAVLSGPARWVGLPLATVFGLIFFSGWIVELDRHVLAVFDQRWIGMELAAGFLRMPMILVILLVLIIDREESRLLLPAFDDGMRHYMHALAIVLAVAWAIGFRPGILVGVPLFAVVIFVIVQCFRAIPMMDMRTLRWPVLDGLALMLASVLIGIGRAYDLWALRRAQDQILGGDLGEHLLSTVHDVLSILMAVLCVIALHRWLDWYMALMRRFGQHTTTARQAA